MLGLALVTGETYDCRGGRYALLSRLPLRSSEDAEAPVDVLIGAGAGRRAGMEDEKERVIPPSVEELAKSACEWVSHKNLL